MLVHMGWVGGDPPPHVLAAVDAVRAASPKCEVLFHADESMVPDQWREVSSTLRPQMRSDVHRHCILRRYGGLWLDVDVRVLRDPAEWADGWDRYTAVRFADGGPLIQSDIIYVPLGWDGWPLIEARIDRVLAEIVATKRVRMLALASRMIEECQRQRPEAFQILDPGVRWPFGPGAFTSDSVVARGFDPRPGLGDRVASALAAVGITEARAQAVAQAIGLEDCGCHGRKAWANRVGTALGLPPGSTASTEN